ncbi:MAG TPA: peptidase S41, partial [Allocoleopsis sp.]
MVTKQGIILTATAAVVTTIGLTGAGIHQISEGQPISLFSSSPKELIDEVWQVIDQSYVDGTFNQQDWRAVRKQYLSK